MAEHRTTPTQEPVVAAALFDQDAAPPPPTASFRRSFGLLSSLLPFGYLLAMTTQWVFGDHVLVVRGIAGLLVTLLAAYHLQSQLSTVSADQHGVWRRYGWLTTRYGWQQHWPWSDIESVTSGTQRVSFHLRRGRTVELVATVISGRDRERAASFAGQLQAMAALAGVPLAPVATWSQRYRRWRHRDRLPRRPSSGS